MPPEDPFPVEGTITLRENGFRSSLPCAPEWLTETENGDQLKKAVHEAAYEYDVGQEIHVIWYASHGICNSYEIVGPASEVEDTEQTEA